MISWLSFICLTESPLKEHHIKVNYILYNSGNHLLKSILYIPSCLIYSRTKLVTAKFK